MLIGREQECCVIGDLMRQRKNILILGEAGVGKSAIVEYVLATGVVKNFLYSKRSTTLKETLVNMVAPALRGRDIQEQNILSLKKICYRLLDSGPEYAVLDHIAWVEPKFYGFLTYMKERNVPFVVVTRSPDKKDIGHLWMGLYDFEKIEIRNLDQTKAGQLIDYYVASFALEIAAAEDFKRAVFKISAGNPKIILELCWLAQDQKYRKKGYVDVKLMDLDRRIKATIT